MKIDLEDEDDELYKRLLTTKEGYLLDVYGKGFYECNSLFAEAGTTGYCGGDAGHGGVTYFSLADLGGTTWDAYINRNAFEDLKKIEIYVGGNSELDTLIKALEFGANMLKNLKGKKQI